MSNQSTPIPSIGSITIDDSKMVNSGELIPGISDDHLALALPVLAYWAVSLMYHVIDTYDLLPQYRLHPPAEVAKRNRVGRWECLRDVIIQQILQTTAGLIYIHFFPADPVDTAERGIEFWALKLRSFQQGIPYLLALMGLNASELASQLKRYPSIAGTLLGGSYAHLNATVTNTAMRQLPRFASWESVLAKAIHYTLYPTIQFIIAIAVIDTWQYFLHRLMHTSRWCYRTFHIRHHRLQAPYAYGALYNHPLEGFVGDTFGTGLAYFLSGMSTRQAMLLFTMATIKTIDDHCGYDIPWDPFQRLTSNNAHYHDIHHQSWGMKTNFAQPFFTFWDDVLGTRWVGPKKVKAAVASR